MSRATCVIVPFVLLAASEFVLADEKEDAQMIKLAKDHGCLLCHSVEPPGPDAVLPIGPAFKDIARRYRDQPNALDRLTRIVLQGSGSSRSGRHWKGSASAEAMFSNAVEIDEADARKLVRWILSSSR
jgi:cytochrome c